MNKKNKAGINFRNPEAPKPEIFDLTKEGFRSTYYYLVDVIFENKSEYPIVQIDAYIDGVDDTYGVKRNEEDIYIDSNCGGNSPIRFIIPAEVFENEKRMGYCFE